MPVTKGVVKAIVLKMIGGVPINGVPTTTALGMPVTTELSLGGLAGMASGIASAAGAASALSSIAQNPVGALTGALESELGDLCKDQFSGLDTRLSSIATDPALSGAYGKLKEAMGGGDGASGALSKIQKFKNHTDRLSGQVMSVDSDLNRVSGKITPGGR